MPTLKNLLLATASVVSIASTVAVIVPSQAANFTDIASFQSATTGLTNIDF